MASPLHLLNACFSLAMVYTCTMLVLHWSRLTPTHFFMPQVSCSRISVFPVVSLLILSTARCLFQIHSRGSTPVNITRACPWNSHICDAKNCRKLVDRSLKDRRTVFGRVEILALSIYWLSIEKEKSVRTVRLAEDSRQMPSEIKLTLGETL